MKEKYVEDYMDELSIYFPEIEQKELTRMMLDITSKLNSYSRNGYRGYTVSTKDTLIEDGKKYKFQVSRLAGKHHYYRIKVGIQNKLKREAEKAEQQNT